MVVIFSATKTALRGRYATIKGVFSAREGVTRAIPAKSPVLVLTREGAQLYATFFVIFANGLKRSQVRKSVSS